MQFTDTIKVQALHYEPNYAVIDKKAYVVDDNGVVTSELDENATAELTASENYDDEGNPVDPATTWVVFGKEKNSIILPNTQATKVSLQDGKDFVYSYEVVVKLKKNLYPFLPKEGDTIWLHKSDGTIDKSMVVKGFVTLKQRYLKIWL